MPFENDYLAQQARRPFHFKSRRADIQLFLSKEFNSILVWSQMMARHVVLTKHKLGPKVTQFLNVTVNSATVRNRPSGPILRTIRSSTTRDWRERSRQSFPMGKYSLKINWNAMNGWISDKFSDNNQFMAFPLVFKHYFFNGKARRERSRRSLIRTIRKTALFRTRGFL